MLKMRPTAKGIHHLWRWPLSTSKKRIYPPCFEWDEKKKKPLHCKPVKIMASSHRVKPVTIIEMHHEAHPENIPLPPFITSSPLSIFYALLSSLLKLLSSWYTVLLSFVWTHCSQQPPCVFLLLLFFMSLHSWRFKW